MTRRFLIGLVGIASLTFGALAFAPTNLVKAQAGGQGVEISPALVEINTEKGNTYNVSVKVTNVTTADLDYIVTVEDFNSKDETGSPQVLIDSNLPESASIKSWVSSIDDFSLKTKEKRTVDFKITVPDNAEPGGHYGVLRFSGTDPQISGSGVGLSASAGTLLLIRVAGEIEETANIESFFTASGESRTAFFENSPIKFVTRIKNTGNIHVKPVGSIEIKNMFGNIVETLPVNDSKGNVLPDSIRKFETSFDKYTIGYYKATLTIGYGTTGQALVATASFWVIPYKIILVAIAALATLIYIMKNLIKAYNRRIIAKSKNETNKSSKKSK